GAELEDPQEPIARGEPDLGHDATARLEPDAAKLDLGLRESTELHQGVVVPDGEVEPRLLVEPSRRGLPVPAGAEGSVEIVLKDRHEQAPIVQSIEARPARASVEPAEPAALCGQ